MGAATFQRNNYLYFVGFFLDRPIEYLKGVGPLRGDLLKKELHIFRVEDLLGHYPFRYIDRTKIFPIRAISEDSQYVQIKGRLIYFDEVGNKFNKRLIAHLRDDTGQIELVWFKGIKWISKRLVTGAEYLVFGKPSVFNGRLNIVHPEEMELISQQSLEKAPGLQPVYPSTEKLKAKGLDSKGILRLVRTVLDELEEKDLPEILPESILRKYRFIPRHEAVRFIHQPPDEKGQQQAVRRLKFEELFISQVRILQVKAGRREHAQGFIFTNINKAFDRFYHHHLKFQLTGAQKKVLKEIRQDVLSGKQMNRLLQGDVGSGKTIVALMTMLMAIDNGYQACLMAPTEILAQQHFRNIKHLLGDLEVKTELLTSAVKGKIRRQVLEELSAGTIHIVAGTHALIENEVQFNNLGLVVIDEQHRFGVAQRAALWEKSEHPPHVLVMTATPIPRTLAMTIYGDLDVSVIDEMPPGRKPVVTRHLFESKRLAMFGFLKEQIAKGRQVYVVYPLIEESEKLDLKNLMEGYESIVRTFPPPQYRVSVLHGQMKAEDKEYEMQRFIKGETHIMVSTTVIEVGVDVPNATVMVIENAERFGLSQLHQLRGRVGRGADQSYCILMSDYKQSQEAKTRLETMVKTNDGFQIAEVDLHMRGPGDIEGTRQSGIMNFKVADIVGDSVILKEARHTAQELLNDDPHLEKPENYPLRAFLSDHQPHKKQWSKIS
ncbi:MAG TPA: ATP-dependent DNA helicase RecG [Chitinophagales bacterium]|nr:ATP-dependent DNA helicase RecG [Chitinophagales bacterium]